MAAFTITRHRASAYRRGTLRPQRLTGHTALTEEVACPKIATMHSQCILEHRPTHSASRTYMMLACEETRSLPVAP